jgi:hypothetical protein
LAQEGYLLDLAANDGIPVTGGRTDGIGLIAKSVLSGHILAGAFHLVLAGVIAPEVSAQRVFSIPDVAAAIVDLNGILDNAIAIDVVFNRFQENSRLAVGDVVEGHGIAIGEALDLQPVAAVVIYLVSRDGIAARAFHQGDSGHCVMLNGIVCDYVAGAVEAQIQA